MPCYRVINRDPELPISSGDEFCAHTAIRVKNRPATRIAYIRKFGHYRCGAGGIRQSSQRIREWAKWRDLGPAPVSGQGGNGNRVGRGNAIAVCDRENKYQIGAVLDPGDNEPGADFAFAPQIDFDTG